MLNYTSNFPKPPNVNSTGSICVARIAATYLAAAVAFCLLRLGGPNSLSYLRYKAAPLIMSDTTYTSIHLAQRPKENVIPGETFSLRTNPLPKEQDLKDGDVVFRSLYLSLDPAMRGMLNGRSLSYIQM